MTPETREQLEDAVFDAFPQLDMDVIESMPDEELRYLLNKDKPEAAKPEKVKEPKQPAIKRERVKVEPQTLTDVFVVSDGHLMRRLVTRQNIGQFTGETVHLVPVGERVRFGDRVYRSSHLLHWLQTGEWIVRVSRAKREPRYKAQVRVGARVLHLGYFASQSERDAAVFAYRLGITPSK